MPGDLLLSLALEHIKDILTEDGNEIMSLNVEVVEQIIKFINDQINYRLLNVDVKKQNL
jgi:hypothetical protein